MGELPKRVLVALIGAPLVIAVIWRGDAALATLTSVMAAVAAWEFFRIARAGGYAPLTWVGTVGASLIPLAVHGQVLGLFPLPPTALVLVVLGVLGAALWTRGAQGKPMAAVAITLFGMAYTGGALSYLYALRYFGYAVGDAAGALVVLCPVALTWASDIGAFFVGRAIGGPKLMPTISPGKTISGAVGGVLMTVGVAVLYVRMGLRPYAQLAFTTTGLIVFAVLISVVGQIGDLAESMLKREGGVKDSGAILPGHGGVLDRVDSLLFVLPVAYVLYGWLLIPAPI